MRPMSTAAVLLPLLLLMGCTASIPVRVDSIADPELQYGKRYLLKSGMVKVSEDDLFFREYSRYFRKILADKGYELASDKQSADLVIRLRYGMSEGKTEHYMYSTPIYDWTGYNTLVSEEITTDATGTSTKIKTRHLPPRERIVGTEVHHGSYISYVARVVLKARSIESDKPAWQTVVHAVTGSDDLRSVMPYLAAAATPYMGKNTNGAIRIKLNVDDSRVLELTQ